MDPAIEGGYYLELPSIIIDSTAKKEWQSFVGDYIEQLGKSFQTVEAKPTPKQQV